MQTLWQDIRYGLRMLARNPGFSVIAVLTLALGIGANTAIFTVMNSVLLSALPVKDPGRLVALTSPDAHGMSNGSQDGDRDLLTYPEFQYMSAHNQVFTGVLGSQSGNDRMNVAVEGRDQTDGGSHASINMVSGSYFSILDVNPVIGRTFGTEVDASRDSNPVAVISYGFWQSRFGGAHTAVGSKIRIGKTSFTVIGVTPPDFFGITVGSAPDVYVPLTMQSEIAPGYDWLSVEKDPVEKIMWLQVFARLKPGVTVAQAKASAEVTFQQYLESQIGSGVTQGTRKDFLNQHIALIEGSHGASMLREQFGRPLVILMGVVGLVLLIACANVANLLLARAASRQKEIAVRVSLGAGRGRLFRQLLTESVLLAGMGGALGLLLAQWADAGLLRLVSHGPSPVPLDVRVEPRIVLFTLGVSLLTGVLFGVAPALRATRVDLNSILKGTAAGAGGNASRSGKLPLGKFLVVGQVALSLLLLIVAGLFVHSFRKLAEAQLGFDRDHLMMFDVDAVAAGYKGPAITELYKELIDRLRTVPGVQSVSISHNGLFSHSESGDQISIDAYTPKSGQEMNALFDHVGPGYFSTVGIPILMGREIGPEDGGAGQRVGVINQTMARYYFGNENPIGRRIWDMFPTTHADFIVVGVAADAKYNSVQEETPRRFYVPYFHPIDPSETNFGRIELRTSGNVATVTAAVRDVVKQTSANLPPIEIHTTNQLVSESLTRDRMLSRLSSVFGALAALLACIGIYGTMAYAVAGRTREIGIRMALGAQQGNVVWMVLRESLLLVAIGVAIGLPAVFGVGKFIGSLLYGLTPADPTALILATILMFVVAGFAGYIPARRAMRVDPMVALRYE
jgi:predicted permease